MGLTLVTAPATEPVDATAAIKHLRLDDGTTESEYVAALTAAAREHVEAHTNRRLVTQTWDLTLDCFPPVIELPYPPLQSVAYIKYIATDGTLTTLDTGEYTVDTKSTPGRVVLAYEKSWPTTRQVINAVTVRFVCGYGTALAVPDAIKIAHLLLMGGMYEFRESQLTEQLSLNPAVASLLSPYRVIGF